MKEIIENLYSKKNVYLAYLRVKNYRQNEELLLEQEIKYFEKDLETNISNITDELLKVDEYEFKKFDLIYKIKSIDDENENTVVSYRPLVRFSFFDEVLMQSVFNIICKELRNFLPKENVGIQLDEDNSPYLYIGWMKQYKKFVKMQRENLSKDTRYKFAYEYDIKQFYPTIQQKKLLEDLKFTLDLDNKSPLYKWLRKILEYYNEENISEETILQYRELNKENGSNYDMGLPQGTLYSSFLASFYTRNLFIDIKSKFKNVEIDVFAYVDDGRLYFKDAFLKKDITEAISDCLNKLNDKNYNKKTIVLNEDKSFLWDISDKSTSFRLDYLSKSISLLNSSIDLNFEIEDDIVDAVIQSHDNYQKTLEQMKKMIETSNGKCEIDDYRKWKKVYSTYCKRKSTFLTRKITNEDNFYKFVDIIFSKYKYGDGKSQNDITTFNYFYNLYNLLTYAEHDESRLKYLCLRVEEMLNSYIEELNIKNDMLLYYYISTIKAIYTIDYSKATEALAIKFFNYFHDNRLFMKFYNSYTKDSWRMNYSMCNTSRETSLFSFKINEYKDKETEALMFYLTNPYIYEYKNNVFHNTFSFKYIVEDSVDNKYKVITVQKYDMNSRDKHKFNYTIKVVYPKSMMDMDDENSETITINLEKLYYLTSHSINDINRVKILKALSNFWMEELKCKNYIDPSYIEIKNIAILKESILVSHDLEILIINNTNKVFYDLDVLYDELEYQKKFLSFFLRLFNCESNITLNEKGRALRFWEYRILSYLKNKGFNKADFMDMLLSLIEEYDFYSHEVDINYERIRKIVDSKLGISKDKDVIMQLHYFLQCMWKNGSKDLPFFTLHNQEHSVELIQNYLELSKRMLSKLSLNKNERFLLFGVCYLHDIGMLKGLSNEEMYDIENEEIVMFYEYIIETSRINSSKFEGVLNNYYISNNRKEQLFESMIRSKHAAKSAKVIKNEEKLPLTDLEKDIIAEVSNSHMLDGNHVYGHANTMSFRGYEVDVRRISMWLRLLDLTDITKYRVTQEVFNNYFDRMSIISRFHWIKHLCVDDIEFIVTQKESNHDIGLTIIDIHINLNYLPPAEKMPTECKGRSSCKLFNESNSRECRVFTHSKDVRRSKKKYCNLRCAFLNENHFFDEEVALLNKYADLYQQHIEFKLSYVLKNEHYREDFEVLSKGSNNMTSATRCIKDFFLRK